MSIKLKNEKGQAMVEFALVLPILLLFLGGIIDFGWIFHNQLSANNACREAARYVAVHYYVDPILGSDTEANSQAAIKINQNIIKSFIIDSDSVTIDHDYETVDKKGGEYIRVNLKGKVIVLTPILQGILGKEFEINSTSTMRIEK